MIVAHKKTAQKTILLLDDDSANVSLSLHTLKSQPNYHVVKVNSIEQAQALCEQLHPQLLLIETLPQNTSTQELCDTVLACETFSHTPTLLFDKKLDARILKKQTILSLSRPFGASTLLDTIDTLLTFPTAIVEAL